MRATGIVLLVACSHSPPPPVAPAGLPATIPVVTGDLHDFDEFAGAWTFTNKRLKARGVRSTDFEEFPSVSCTTTYLDGVANVDEIFYPTKGWRGLTVRTFDKQTRQWSIYWINMRDGKVTPPVLGGFTNSEGNFYGNDTDGDRPVISRFHWIKTDHDHLTWEQWFSYDQGKTWEMNWTNTLTRTDWDTVCEKGRPKPSRP